MQHSSALTSTHHDNDSIITSNYIHIQQHRFDQYCNSVYMSYGETVIAHSWTQQTTIR